MRRFKGLGFGSAALALLLAGAPATAQVVRTPQVPLAGNKIPQFVQQLPLLSLDNSGIKVAFGADPATGESLDVDVSLCEFQMNILPAGSLGKKNAAAPQTWVWGYQSSSVCGTPAGSYIGPVVLAKRGVPTQMTYNNHLPDADTSHVQAYTTTTDQTLQWADPFSLQALGAYPQPTFANDFVATPWVMGVPGFPEENTCNDAAKVLIPGQALPAPCLDNYGFYLQNAALYAYSAPVPAAPHLHGGEIPAMLDGGPDAWFTPNGIYGHGYYSKNGTADAAAGKAVYTYPNGQEAAPIWFHDHVLGATRLNVYAGIAGGWMISDDILANTGTLPTGLLPLGLDRNGNDTLDLVTNAAGDVVGISDEVLIPVVIQDRMFDTAGQLFFPAVGLNPEHPFWVPEFVGDVIVVNGKAWPTTTVEPKRYRFLFLNGSNARAYELFLLDRLAGVKGPAMWVIGNDQGYLDTPQLIDPNGLKPNDKLVIMPGERYEVVIDFGASAGATLELRNTAKTPYPGGAPASGSTTGKIMQFVVSATCASGQCNAPLGLGDTSYDPAAAAPASTIRIANPINRLADPLTGTVALTAAGTPVAVDKVRQLTLNEVIGPGGPLEILMNNTTYKGDPTARQAAGFSDFTQVPTQWDLTSWYSEFPVEGTTEIWEIVNITADAHPIHPHLVGFQILNREAFDFKGFDAAYNLAFPGGLYIPGFGPPCDYSLGCAPVPGVPPRAVGGNPDITPFLSGVIMPPNLQEQGWKDTAISYPGEVLRLMIRFAPTPLPNDTLAADAFYDFSPAEGHGYVWHCHIIDHEDNEMMRPFAVDANPDPGVVRTFVQGIDY